MALQFQLFVNVMDNEKQVRFIGARRPPTHWNDTVGCLSHFPSNPLLLLLVQVWQIVKICDRFWSGGMYRGLKDVSK